jgi:hypothetical protein
MTFFGCCNSSKGCAKTATSGSSSRSDIATIREIAAELRTYVPNCPLWVNGAGAAHAPGSVECIADGVLLGFFSCFGTYDGDPRLSLKSGLSFAPTRTAYGATQNHLRCP